ncbi:hypothetical protein BHE74_00050510, partial [Ensete ventricosum]
VAVRTTTEHVRAIFIELSYDPSWSLRSDRDCSVPDDVVRQAIAPVVERRLHVSDRPFPCQVNRACSRLALPMVDGSMLVAIAEYFHRLRALSSQACPAET